MNQYLNFKSGSNYFVSFIYYPFRNSFHVCIIKNNRDITTVKVKYNKVYKYEYTEVRVTPTSYHEVLFNRAILEGMKDLLAKEAHKGNNSPYRGCDTVHHQANVPPRCSLPQLCLAQPNTRITCWHCTCAICHLICIISTSVQYVSYRVHVYGKYKVTAPKWEGTV